MAVEVAKKYLLGDFEVDPSNHLLTRGQTPVALSRKRFQVLLYLLKHPGRLVTREELLERFWNGSEVYEDNLTKCVSEIRKALDDQRRPYRLIETVPGVGYRYIGPLEEALQPAGTSFEIERTRGVRIVVHEDDEQDTALDSQKTLTRKQALLTGNVPPVGVGTGPWLRPALWVAVVIAVAASAFALYRFRTPAVAVAPAPIRSIAVLPLRSLSGTQDEEYFSDGLTDSMMTRLSHVEGMKVISRSSVFRFKGKDIDPREVGKQLGVAAVVEGSVRKHADTIRVALRLVSAEDGRVLWATEGQGRTSKDLFALQDEIARNLAAGLKVNLSGGAEQRLAARQTDSAEAYQLYLKGRFYLNKYNLADIKKSIDYFNQAIANDPDYALAYAGLADSHIALGVDFRPPGEVFPQAKVYAQKAIALNDKLGEGHFALGEVHYFYDWDWAAAQKELELTLQLDPQATEKSACYVHSLDATGNSEGAITHVRRALELNPLSIGIQGELGCASYYARQYDQALAFSRQTLEMDPNFDMANYNIARAYGQKGMYGEAMRALNNIGPLSELPPMIVAELGYVHARLGEKDKARTMLDELKVRTARGEYVDPYPVSFIYAGLGETEQALEYLQRSVKIRSSWIPWLKVEPKFDSLRKDRRFENLLTKVGIR